MGDFIQNQALLGLPARIKKLSDYFQHEQRRIYKNRGRDLQFNWHLILLLLQEKGELGVMKIAEELGLSHPAAVNTLKRMHDAGYLESRREDSDKRKQYYDLSAKAQSSMPGLEKDWEILRDSLKNSGAHFLNIVLLEYEANLRKKSWYEHYQDISKSH